MLISKPQTLSSPDIELGEMEPPTPAYFPPLNGIPPIPSVDAGLAEYTRVHGHSEIPLSPRQPEDDRTSFQASEAHTEALPAYKADTPPTYSHTRRFSAEPTTWPTICFRIGFLFPPFWLCGALTLIPSLRDSINRIFMPWFKDFVPSANAWCDSLETEAEKEAYLVRIRVAERRGAKMCLFALSIVLCFIIAIAVTLIGVTSIH